MQLPEVQQSQATCAKHGLKTASFFQRLPGINLSLPATCLDSRRLCQRSADFLAGSSGAPPADGAQTADGEGEGESGARLDS